MWIKIVCYLKWIILVKAKIKFEKKGIERKKEYIKIFPTEQKYITRETVELEKFCSDLAKVKETNMEEFVEFCLTCQWLYNTTPPSPNSSPNPDNPRPKQPRSKPPKTNPPITEPAHQELALSTS